MMKSTLLSLSLLLSLLKVVLEGYYLSILGKNLAVLRFICKYNNNDQNSLKGMLVPPALHGLYHGQTNVSKLHSLNSCIANLNHSLNAAT